MLLSKNEKKWNVIYLATLVISVVSFYLNIINNYKFFVATALSISLLFLCNLVYYNTFNKFFKKVLIVIYSIFLIWMVANKVYFTFYGDYINFVRITTAAPSMITTTLFTMLKSISLLFLIITSSLNFWSFKRAKFRLKRIYIFTLPLLIIFLIVTITFKTYNYEILSYMFCCSIDSGYDTDNYKPITSSRNNMFDELLSKTHSENAYTGIAEGKNLILVQCESLQNTFTNKEYDNGTEKYEVTPVLNDLIKNDSLYFNNCFAQIGWGNTSDAEFVVNNSFYPLAMQSIYQRCTTNYFYGMPKILAKNGYTSSVYHGYVANMWNRDVFYPVEGFTKYLHSENYPTDQFIGFGIADREFFTQTAKYMTEETTPAYSFVISLSSHNPYNVSDTMSDIVLKDSDKDSLYGNYIININYLDSAIGTFMEELKANGLYDNSIIVFYGDHHGLNKSDPDNYKHFTSYLGKPYEYDDMLNIPFIIHIPGLGKSETITTTCGQMDIMPTLLNMLGIENDTIYFGQDIMSLKQDDDRAIGGTTYMPTGSFIDKDYVFIMSSDSIYEHATIIDRKTGGAATNVVSRDKLYAKSKKIQDDVKLSNIITERDLLEALLRNDPIVLNDVNPQPYIFNINSDTDQYNYADRLKEATEAGFNLVSVKVFTDDDEEFYVSNKLNVFNKMKLIDFLELAKTYPDTYVILTDIKEIESDLFRYLGKEHPDLAAITIPEIYSFADYNNTKTFNMNTPILSLDYIDCNVEELISFVASNKVFALLSSTDNFKANYVDILARTYNTFSYVKTVNDKGEITYYKDKNVNGFYTDSLELAKYKKLKVTRFN